MFSHFLLGFLSVFKLGGVSIKRMDTFDISEDFTQVNEDLNNSFKKLKSEYEGQ